MNFQLSACLPAANVKTQRKPSLIRNTPSKGRFSKEELIEKVVEKAMVKEW